MGKYCKNKKIKDFDVYGAFVIHSKAECKLENLKQFSNETYGEKHVGTSCDESTYLIKD